MLSVLNELGPELTLQPGVNAAAIEQAQRDFAWTLPEEYTAFLRAANGAVGMLASGDYVDLWPVEQLVTINREYGFPESCPEVIAFGSNGGGEAFVFRRSNGHIALVPFIGMSIDDALDIAATFTGFLRRARPPHWL